MRYKGFPKKFKVNVTKRDIERGLRMSAISCPIARAVKRSFPGRKIAVNTCNPGKIFVGKALYSLPPEGFIFADAFDSGYPSEPITFESERILPL